MKNAKLLFLSLLVFLLCSCNIFGDINSKNESNDGLVIGAAYTSEPGKYVEHNGEYTSSDISYYKSADELITICDNIGIKRTFYKAYDGYCAVGLANIDKQFGPVLVGEDPVQVCYKSTKNDSIIGYAGNFELNGKTFYYSSNDHFIDGKLKGDREYGNYFSTFTTLEEAAKDIAEKSTFVPVSKNQKIKFKYKELDTGLYSISAGPYATIEENLVLPAKYNNVNIAKVEDNGFSWLSNLKSLAFEEKSNYKSIGERAFYGCSSLSYAVLPSTLTWIGDGAFHQCPSSLLIFAGFESWNDTYKWLSGTLFYGYTGYVEDGDFTFGITLDGEATIAKYRGEGGDVEVPDTVSGKTVVGIEDYAFENSSMLRSVSFPKTLRWIGRSAFSGCTRLTKVEIPKGAKSIGERAFYGCSSLSYAVLPSTLTWIGDGAFHQCPSSLLIFAGFESWNDTYKWLSGTLYLKGKWHYSDDGTPTPNN